MRLRKTATHACASWFVDSKNLEGSGEVEKGSREQWSDFKDKVCFDSQDAVPFAL